MSTRDGTSRCLVDVFGDRARDPEATASAAWVAVDRDGTERRGEVVLDRRNRRVKLYDVAAGDVSSPALVPWRRGLAESDAPYDKLTVYARPGADMGWIIAGFLYEGAIAGYFADGEDAWLWAEYGDESRSEAPRDGLHDETVRFAAAKPVVTPRLAAGCACHRAESGDAAAIAALMSDVFTDYPTRITARELGARIADGSHLCRIVTGPDGNIVAAASAGLDHQRSNAEMTDCATRPDQRGAGHMAYLVHRLEQDLADDLGIRDFYTLARADEVGMNCVFAKLGYAYTGRLVNNCRMPNGWESMNIWCKRAGGDVAP